MNAVSSIVSMALFEISMTSIVAAPANAFEWIAIRRGFCVILIELSSLAFSKALDWILVTPLNVAMYSITLGNVMKN